MPFGLGRDSWLGRQQIGKPEGLASLYCPWLQPVGNSAELLTRTAGRLSSAPLLQRRQRPRTEYTKLACGNAR